MTWRNSMGLIDLYWLQDFFQQQYNSIRSCTSLLTQPKWSGLRKVYFSIVWSLIKHILRKGDCELPYWFNDNRKLRRSEMRKSWWLWRVQLYISIFQLGDLESLLGGWCRSDPKGDVSKVGMVTPFNEMNSSQRHHFLFSLGFWQRRVF